MHPPKDAISLRSCILAMEWRNHHCWCMKATYFKSTPSGNYLSPYLCKLGWAKDQSFQKCNLHECPCHKIPWGKFSIAGPQTMWSELDEQIYAKFLFCRQRCSEIDKKIMMHHTDNMNSILSYKTRDGYCPINAQLEQCKCVKQTLL